jgi:hypothetical protein
MRVGAHQPLHGMLLPRTIRVVVNQRHHLALVG